MMRRLSPFLAAGYLTLALATGAGAQIRPPGSGAGAGEMTVITVSAAEDFARRIGLTDIETKINDDKSTSVYGKAKGVDVEVSLGECNTTCDSSFELYAYFGMQNDVDAKFINAFNLGNHEKLVILKDGDLALNLTMSLLGGVTMNHLGEVGKSFVSAIDDALSFKPE